MAEERIDSSLLGAYVDGELDAAESARIAAAVARDCDVARQVMVLSRLKSAAAASDEQISIDLPAERPSRSWVQAIAAGVLIAMFGAGAFWLAVGDGNDGGQTADYALDAHRSWSTATQGDAVDPKVVLAAAPDFLTDAYVPDLTSAKLRLVHSAIVRGKSGPALVAGYTGSRGCRVTLLVTAAGGETATRFAIKETAGLISAHWRAGPLNYAILAKGMARKRFRLLASSVFEASLEAVPINRQTRLALARSRAQSKPCMLA